MYDNKITGIAIRDLRHEADISQEVLSGLAEVSRSHLSGIENGSINASVDTLWKISKALEIRFSDLMRIVEEKL